MVSAVPLGTAGAQNTTTDGTYVGVTNVTVSPENPAPGEAVTVEPTIENLRDSTGVVDIDAVALRNPHAGGSGERVRVTDVGNVAPDSSISVPMTTEFGEAGTKQLRVHVYGQGADGSNINVQYPVTVTVEEHHPQLDIETNETVAGTDGTGTITVANGLSTTARNVDVTLTSDALSVTDDRFVVPSIDSGGSATESFEFSAESAGTYPVTATMRYRVDGSTQRVTEQTTTVEIDRLRDNVVLEATAPDSGSSTIEVDVLNRGNVPIENVTVGGQSSNATVPSTLVTEIPAGESTTKRLNASLDGASAEVRMAASYDIGDQHGRATDAVSIRSIPGEIDLTGVSVERDGDRLRVTGSASNSGATAADGVIVRVADTESVTPAAPSREYFVGSVPESDFVSFEVYARTDGNVSEIPLEVSYRADGEEYERTVSVPMDGSVGNASAERVQDSSGGLLVPAVGGIVLLVVGVVGVRSWRANRAGS